ncbi:MAG: spermidine/putrescine ABC transporter substrate-binding protein [Angelakisella sp.]
MKKMIALTLAATMALTLLAGCGSSTPAAPSGSNAASPAAPAAPTAGGELNIFTWDGYFPQDVIDGFIAETGIKINFSNFETNEEMLTKLEATKGGDYDLVIASDYIIDIARKKGGLLGELDKAQLPNFANLDESFLNKYYDEGNKYTVPYAAGNPLIVYDPAKVPFEITGYADLWKPELADSIAAIDDGRNMIGITLRTMGKTMNETDPAVLAEAGKKLNELTPNIRVLTYNNIQDAIIGGEATVGYMFTSQAAMALEARPDLKVCYPKEGMGFGIDSMFVPINAPHKENAHKFINYILDAEVGAKVSSQVYYLCPNKASAPFLPESFVKNPAFNAPAELLSTAQFIEDVGEATATYDKIWTEFKGGM